MKRLRWTVLLLALAGLLGGCGAPGPLMPDQRPLNRSAATPPPAPEAYRVQSGDTLYSIAFRYGLDWRSVARWNGISAPYTIRVGQTLRLRRPATLASSVAQPAPSRSPPASSPPRSTPSPSSPAPRPADPPARAEPAPAPRTTPPSSPPTASGGTTPIPTAATRSVGGVVWRWPTAGTLARGFNPGDARKGILIAGTPGQPVRAAADGTVVYSGNGLIGYGELIIVKHNDRMLSAYAHNRERSAAEGDTVRAGQQIATLGRNERDEPVLHFEIRRDGQPVDPIGYLPAR